MVVDPLYFPIGIYYFAFLILPLLKMYIIFDKVYAVRLQFDHPVKNRILTFEDRIVNVPPILW